MSNKYELKKFTNHLWIINENSELEKQNTIIRKMPEEDQFWIGIAQELSPGHITTIFEYDKKKPIGFIDLNRYNGKSKNIIYIYYALDPNYRGRGIIQKLIKKACNYAYENGFTKIIAMVDKRNIASQKALEKTNMFIITRETKYELKYECNVKEYYIQKRDE